MGFFGAKIRLTVDDSGQKEFSKQIQDYVDAATKSQPVKIKNITFNIAGFAKKLKDLQTEINNASGLTVKIDKIDTKDAIDKLRGDIETMLSGLSVGGLKAFLKADGIDETIKKVEELNDKTAKAQTTIEMLTTIKTTARRALADAMSGSQGVNSEELQLIIDRTRALTGEINALVKNEETASAVTDEQIRKLGAESAAVSELVTSYQKEQKAVKDTGATKQSESQKAIEAKKKEISVEESSIKTQLQLQKQAATLEKTINNYVKSNPKAYQVYGTQLDSLLNTMKMVDLESGNAKEQLQAIATEFLSIQVAAQRAGNTGNTLFTLLQKGWEKFGGWSLVTKTMTAAVRAVKQMVVAVKELDAAMTELKKVTDLSEQSYRNYINTASQTAKRIGATLSDVINATADFSRIGYNLADSASLAEAALVYKNVGDGIDDIAESSESIISTIKAFEQFGVSASNAMNIVDKFNEVGNNFAISSEGIGTALQKSASALAAANNTIDESIALAAGMNSVLQNPEQVGTALKTLSMYLRAAKTEAEEAGESTEGMASSVSKLRKELLTLTKGRVDIMVDDTQFKSTYQIIKELSKVWSDLSDIDTANILERIGGKRNAAAVTSLITNFKDAEAAMVASQNAAGSALAENEKYLESIQGKLDVIRAKFESMSNNLIDNSIVKFILDIASALMSVVEGLTKIHMLLPLIATTLTTITAIKGLSGLSKISTDLVATLTAMKQTGAVIPPALIGQINGLSDAMKNQLNIAIKNTAEFGNLGEKQQEYVSNVILGTTATNNLNASTKAATFSLKALFASNPIGWIATAASWAVMIISNVVESINKARQASIDAAHSIVDAWGDEQKTRRDNQKSLEAMRAEYEALAAGVDRDGKNVSLTSDEYERYLALVDQIINTTPQIVQGWNEKGEAVLNYKTALDDAIAVQKSLEDAALNTYLSGGKKLFEGLKTEYEDIRKEVAEMGKLAAGVAPIGHALTGNSSQRKEFMRIMTDELGLANNEFYNKMVSQSDYAETTFAKYYLSDADTILALYENIDKLRIELNKSSAYTATEASEAARAIMAVASSYQDLMTIQQQASDYFVKWFETDPNANWIYQLLPNNAKDVFQKRLSDVLDVRETLAENESRATEYLQSFVNVIQSNFVQNIKQMSKSMSADEYEKYLNDLPKLYSNFFNRADEDVVASIMDYLRKFNVEVENGNSIIPSYEANLKELKTVISDLEGAYKILSTAQTEMKSGGLSSETVQSLMSALGEEEKLIDYLYVENGLVKLNIEAWQKRSDNIYFEETKEIQKEIEYLQRQNEQLDINSDEYKQNSDKIKENQMLLAGYKTIFESITKSAKTFVDAVDFSSMKGSISDTGKSISGLQSAMEQLAKGTSLSKEQLVQLALEYPKLLEASNLFTDGSIAGQQKMLDNLYKVYAEEYDATVDLEINKLTAINTSLQERINAEMRKLELVNEISATEVQDTLTYRSNLVDKLNEYNDIEGKNYVAFKEGELQVSEDALNKMLAQTSDAVASSEAIWADQSVTIAGAFEKGGEGALEVLEEMRTRTETWVGDQKKSFGSLAETIAHAMSGDAYKVYDNPKTTAIDTDLDSGVRANSSIKDRIKERKKQIADMLGESAIGEYTLDEWVSNRKDDWVNAQKQIIDERIKALKEQLETNNQAIQNLEKLKGIDLKSMFFSDKSSKTEKDKKAVEEYVATVDAYYDALKRLGKAQEQRANIERQLSNENDLQSKIELERQLINAYKEEIAAEANLVSERKNTIEANVEALRELGFAVEYVAESNDLYISNWSHVNDLIADSKGDYETVEEATNELVKSTEELLKTTDELNESNKEATSSMIGLGYAIDTSNQNILEYIDAMATNAKQALSDVAGAYKTLLDAVNGYNESGNISVDTFQSLLDLSPAYLTYLQNESGEMKLNKEALEELIKKKVENLAISKAMALVDTIHEYRDNEAALRELASATGEATKATWDFVYANLAAENLDSALYDAFKAQIDALRSLVGEVNVSYEDAGKSIDEVIAEINKKADEAKQALSEVAGAYRTLIDAVDSYNESGYLSLDTFQQIMDLSPAYIAYLYDESGAINLNRGALEELIAAKVENLALSKAMALVDSIHQYAGDAEALYALATATTVATGATWDLVYARLAAENLDAELNDAFVAQIDAIRNLAATAQAGIGQSFAKVVEETKSSTEATNSFNKAQQEANEDANKALKEQLEKQKEILKNEADKKIDALKDQISKFREIVELKKKSLEASKDEREYEEDIADRIKAIADLQSRIDQLSLDDSRQAQAERQSLMEELMQKQKDLADVQGEHAYDAQMDALDELADNYEKEKNAEIERIEKNLAREQKIYDDALDRLENGAGSVYGQIEAMNINAGNSIYNNLTVGWNQATRAVQDYGASVAAVTGAQITIPNNAMSPLYSRVDAAELYHQLGGTNSAALLPAFNATAGTASGLTSRKLQEVYNGIGGVSNSSNSSFVYEPTISVSINSNGALSGSSANDFGTQVANVAIQQLNDALARKGIGSSTIATLKAL